MTPIDCALTNQALRHYDKSDEVGGLALILDMSASVRTMRQVPPVLYSQSYIKATRG